MLDSFTLLSVSNKWIGFLLTYARSTQMYQYRMGARAKLQLFWKPLDWALACGGLQMCCNVRGLLTGAFPNAPKRRNARGVKKIKTPCIEVSKSINPICLFICSHCQVSENVSKSGVWLAPNGRKYMQLRICVRCPVRVPLMFVRKTAARVPLKPQLSYIFC